MAQRLPAKIAVDIRPAPAYVDAKSLGVNTAETFAVPAGYNVVVFGASATPFYVRVGAAAALPADTADGTASECNPTAYQVNPGDTISVITPAATIVTAAYYKAFGA